MTFTDGVRTERDWPTAAEVEAEEHDKEHDEDSDDDEDVPVSSFDRYRMRKQLFDQLLERHTSITAAALHAIKIEYILMYGEESPEKTE